MNYTYKDVVVSDDVLQKIKLCVDGGDYEKLYPNNPDSGLPIYTVKVYGIDYLVDGDRVYKRENIIA